MPQHGDFNVQIKIDGHPAQEYNVATTIRPGGVSETRTTICSVSGARFGANMRVVAGRGGNYLGQVYVDGKFVIETAETLSAQDYLLDYAVDGSSMRPLEFAPTHAVADVGELAGRHDVAVAEDRVAGEVGTIKVEIWAARFVQDHTVGFGASNWKQSMLSEKQKKAVFVTHSARIGDPIGDYVCPASLGHPVNLAAVFVFEYASKGTCVLAIVPQFRQPSPPETPCFIRNSRDIWPHSSYRSTRHPCSCSRSSTFLIHVDQISQEASSRIECS